MIPWFSKTERNTYATIAASPFPLQGKPTQAQDIARRISGAFSGRSSLKSRFALPTTSHFWRRCRGIYAKVNIPSTHHKPLSPALHYLPFASHFHLPPLHPCRFIRPLFFVRLFLARFCLRVCWIACLSRWLKIILNCVTLPIPTTMIFLAL